MTITAPVLSTYQQRARGAEYLDRAREVARVIEAEANAIETEATITRPVYEALAEAGLFWILVPEEYGGAGLDIVSAFKVVQEITRADGSTGWAFMANSCSTGVAVGYTNPDGAREMFAGVDKGITAGMIVPTGTGVRVDGGYRVTGRFQFASGSAHASWIGAGFVVHDDQGNPMVGEDGQPEARIAWIPRENIEFLGNWDVMGMVGTGSYDYRVTDVFVAERFTMNTFSTVPVRPESVYKLGLLGIGVGGHAPVHWGWPSEPWRRSPASSRGRSGPDTTVPSVTPMSSVSSSPATKPCTRPPVPTSTRYSGMRRRPRQQDCRSPTSSTRVYGRLRPGFRRSRAMS